MQVWNVLRAARWKCRTQKIAQKSPSGHHRTTLSGYIFTTKASIDSRKKLVKQQYLPHISSEYGELRPTSSWDLLASMGHPCKFQRVSRLCSVTARHSSSGRWTEGATYIQQGGHHVEHWPTFLVVFVLSDSRYTQTNSSGQHQYGDVLNCWCWLRVLDRCTWTLPCEYDWTVCVQRRCSLMSNYFGHLLKLVIVCCSM